jgi:hypothetical protein
MGKTPGVDDEAGTGGRRRWITIGTVVLAVVVVSVGLTWALTRDTAREVSVDEARERAGGGTTVPAGPPDIERPPPGVYEYRGAGSESLSVPPLSQDQGPTIPGTVELLDDGCWTLRVDFSTNHWQSWRYCRDGAGLVEAGGQSWQRWMVGPTAITNLTTSTCEDTVALPAEREEGQEWPARCVATNEAVEGEAVSSGVLRFVGEEDVVVGGDTVRAAHLVREREMSGAQEGTERTDLWVAVDTGLPLRNERRVEAATDTPVGPSTYTEIGSFDLVTLVPR